MVNNVSRRQKIILGFVIAAGIAGGALYWGMRSRVGLRVGAYHARTDRQCIIDLFEKNKYWLTTNTEYDVAHMLETRSPNSYGPEYFGKLTIKVGRFEGKPVGFVAYYKKTFYEGLILFLAVASEYRGKRFAQTLLRYGVKQLFKDHASVVKLVTRTNNYSAMKVYKRVGFNETGRTDGFVYFSIRPDAL